MMMMRETRKVVYVLWPKAKNVNVKVSENICFQARGALVSSQMRNEMDTFHFSLVSLSC